MDPKEALTVLRQVAEHETLKLSRREHAVIEQALRAVSLLLPAEPAAEHAEQDADSGDSTPD